MVSISHIEVGFQVRLSESSSCESDAVCAPDLSVFV